MKLETILKTYAWFIFSYGQWMLFRTKQQFKDYKRDNPTIHRIKDLRPITEIEATFACEPFLDSKAYEIIDGMAVPLAIEMIDGDCEAIENEVTINVAPRILDPWFVERASEFEFAAFGMWCSACGKDDAFYIGVTRSGIPFTFCRECRDDLVQIKLAKQSQMERIPA